MGLGYARQKLSLGQQRTVAPRLCGDVDNESHVKRVTDKMSSFDYKEVCHFCYKLSSHKTKPTYTPRSKVIKESLKDICSVCRQTWQSQIIAQTKSGKFIAIRPRPPLHPNVDYTYCVSVTKGVSCLKGPICTFAHHQAELYYWAQERSQKEPRSTPLSKSQWPYQLCKSIEEKGFCSYGSRCTFAHSKEELELWKSVKNVTGNNPPSQVSQSSLYCSYCNVKCTSQKQLEQHNQGNQHKHAVMMNSNPGPLLVNNPSIRPRPLLNFLISDYKLCNHVLNHRYCAHGNACTFAHSLEELEEWNRELNVAKKRPLQMTRFMSKEQCKNLSIEESNSPLHSGRLNGKDVDGVCSLDAIEDDDHMDFADAARIKLLTLWKNKQEDQDILSNTDGVTIQEVNGRPLSLNLTQSSQEVSWTFKITTNGPEKLLSVVLFDALCDAFSVKSCFHHIGGKSQSVNGATSWDNASIQYSQTITPGSRLNVQVLMKPISGVKEQIVLFHFDDFLIVKPLRVQTLSAEAQQAMQVVKNVSKRPAKIDLYWELHFTVEQYTPDITDPTDELLKKYNLPEKIEQFLEEGRYNNMERNVTKENYTRRMHNLLFLEQYQQRKDLSRYDIYDALPNFSESYTGEQGSFHMAPGFAFFRLEMEEELFEGRRSIKPGDVALVLPSGQKTAYGCPVEFVGRQHVTIKVSNHVKDQCVARGGSSIRFTVDHKHFDAMHNAVDGLDSSVIFPSIVAHRVVYNTKECLSHIDRSLNKSQLDAIHSVLNLEMQSIPTLVCGPFGCGKTRTLRECIRLLLLYAPNTRLLLATQSNTAADLYVEDLDKEVAAVHKSKIFRLYYVGRRPSTISPVVLKYSKYDQNKRQLVYPDHDELLKYRLVVTTLQTARSLKLKKFDNGYFTHIFLDEAAQALESEAVIPLSLASKKTKLVLAGDKMQTNTSVYSPLARKYGLDNSLLERLYDDPIYKKGLGIACRVELNENRRSHKDILEVPSKLFYSGSLKAFATFPPDGPKGMPAVTFIEVAGEERRDEDSPSLYNVFEAEKVVEKVFEFCDKGLPQQSICVLTLYRKQIGLIRQMLRQKKMSSVQVRNIDGVQGMEYRALLLSTVRTCVVEPNEGEESSFLSNPKLFNTAVTRAQEWLVVVGEPVTLCSVGSNRTCWLEFIRKCVSLDSFVYPSPHRFERNIENRLIAKQIQSSLKEKYPLTQTINNDSVVADTKGDAFSVMLDRFNSSNVTERKTMVLEKVKDALDIPMSAEKMMEISERLLFGSDIPQLVRLLNNPTELQAKLQAIGDRILKFENKSSLPNVDVNLPKNNLTSNGQPLLATPNTQPAALLGFGPTMGIRPQVPVFQAPHMSLQNMQNQLSVILSKERNCLLEQENWLKSQDIANMPFNVQANLRQQKEVLQRQFALLDEQTKLLSGLLHLSQQPASTFPPSRPASNPFTKTGILPQPNQFRPPTFPFHVPRMPMGFNMNPAVPQHYFGNRFPVRESTGDHDLNWDDL